MVAGLLDPRGPAPRETAWPQLSRGQLAIWFGFAAAYQVARGLADRGATEAFANARRVIHAEERLGVLFELDLQRSVVETGGLLLHAVNWTYWLSQFMVVGLALLWIYLRRYPAYLRVRNTIIVANAIGLVGYVAMPTAPPRLLPEFGFADTLAQSEWLNHGTGLVVLASNPHAAMPSLHTADALIIGFALAMLVRSRALKALFLLWPAWVAFSLIASGNHFALDIAAGAVLAAVGAWVARRLERCRPVHLHRQNPAPVDTRLRLRPRSGSFPPGKTEAGSGPSPMTRARAQQTLPTGGAMSGVLGITGTIRRPKVDGRERFEVCEVAPTVPEVLQGPERVEERSIR